tara:strand:+ start:6214 stop:7662 length:1449 start_codon:yes stop_codon:yes gene_type:complete
MANGIGSLLERYGNPQTKAELAGSVLAGVSPAGGLLDAITSALAVKEGEYGKAALYALGAGLPFVSGSPLHKLGKQILGKRSRNRPGVVKPEVTDREVSQLRALNASDGQILQLNRQIKAQRKQSTMSRRASAKTRPPAERTFNRSGTTPRVGGGQGWLDVGKKETAEAIDPSKAIARRLQKEQDEALLSLDDQFRLSGPDQKLVLDKNWAHLWAPESIPSQVNLLRLVEEGKLTQEQYLLIKRIVEARKRNPRAKSPLTHEQMRSLDFPLGAKQDDASREILRQLSPEDKARLYPLGGGLDPAYNNLLEDIALNPRTLARTAKQEEKIAKILAKGGNLTESEMQELYEWAIQPGLPKFNRVLPLAPEQRLLEQGYDMTGYYGSALVDDVGKGIMSLPVTKTNLGRGSVVTTDPNLAIRYAQRGPGEGIITPLRFKSQYALPMESGPNTPLSRYFLDPKHTEDYILNKPLSLEEFIASIREG